MYRSLDLSHTIHVCIEGLFLCCVCICFSGVYSYGVCKCYWCVFVCVFVSVIGVYL